MPIEIINMTNALLAFGIKKISVQLRSFIDHLRQKHIALLP